VVGINSFRLSRAPPRERSSPTYPRGLGEMATFAFGADYLKKRDQTRRQYSRFVYVCPDDFGPRHACDSVCSESAMGKMPIVYSAI
jgi:hypothetical protein